MKVLKVVYIKTVRSPSSFLRADGPLPGYHHLLTSYQSDRMVPYKGASGVTVPGHSAVQENPMCRVMTGSQAPSALRSPQNQASFSLFVDMSACGKILLYSNPNLPLGSVSSLT